MLFHEYLDTLLEQMKREGKGNNKALAQHLNVHASMVTRWTQGFENIPRSDQLIGIVQFFHLSAADEQKLRDAYAQSEMMNGLYLSPRTKMKDDDEVDDAVSDLIKIAGAKEAPRIPVAPAGVDLRFLQEDKVYYEAQLLEKVTFILQGILQKQAPFNLPSPGKIYMTRQGGDLGSQRYPDLWQKWKEALIQLLQNGWQIVHLFRLNTDPKRSVNLVKDTLEYLKYGDYQPYYFNSYGLMSVPVELFIIPERAGMMQLSTDELGHANGGLLTGNAEQVRFFTQYFEMLKRQTSPLITTYDKSYRGQQRYLDIVEKAENAKGGRYLQKSFGGLSYLTHPLAWFDSKAEWWQKVNLPGSEIERIAQHHRNCYAAFLETMNDERSGMHYRDVCDLAKVEEQARNGEYYAYYDTDSRLTLSPQARIEHLMHTITLLEENPRYEIALLDKAEIGDLFHDSFWEIAGRRYVIMGLETISTGYITVSFDEPLIAVAFNNFFMEFWEHHISKDHYDKSLVIGKLKKLIKMLEDGNY